LTMAPVNIGRILRDIIEVERDNPAASKITIAFKDDSDGAYVLADMVRVEQVVMNLLSNAVKFTPSVGHIDVRAERDGELVRIDVVDNGQGIAPDFLPRVFDMYGQSMTVTTRSKGGLGIGLALVREIIELHGGKVEAFSEGIGKGARFSFWLPVFGGKITPQHDGRHHAEEGLVGLRILVVDDMQDMLQVFTSLLEVGGATVFAATSAREGLDILTCEDVDLLISDISMPEIDGYEFLRWVRINPKLAALPAIAISGMQRDNDIANAHAAGFSAHLGKPISVERLSAVIHDLLPGRLSGQ